ncbi:MAG: helicase-related protein [Acidithiobacillus sp.]|nr:helicase-related protein [Acidithiobacillus sp.]
MQIKQQTMTEFMSQFGSVFFNKAAETLQPTFIPGNESAKIWENVVDATPKKRNPFPGQRTLIAAVAAHLYGKDKRAIILSADMGTGKTLMATLLAALGTQLRRPQRVICMVPPHLVAKWGREIQITIPEAKVHTINDAGSIGRLHKAALENPDAPKTTEFWIVGRVRARMSFMRKSGVAAHHDSSFLELAGAKARNRNHKCPDCGGAIVKPLTEKEVEKLPDDQRHRLIRISGDDQDQDLETGSCSYAIYPNAEYFTKGRKTCEWTYSKDGLKKGCGAPLWQATRRAKSDTDDLIRKALVSVDGIGETRARTILSMESRDQIISGLASGEIHPDLAAVLGESATAKASNHIQQHGFSGVDGNYAISEFIKRKLPKHWFDISVFDELHELDGDDTAQGVAMGVIAGCTKKIVGLTGTLVDGYAGSLFPLLFRINPRQMLRMGFKAGDAAIFQREKGVIKEISVEYSEDEFKQSKGKKKSYRQTKNLPGLHPTVITDFLLPNTVFIELQDMEEGLQNLGRKHDMDIRLLPSYRETYISVQQREEQKNRMRQFTTRMVSIIKDAKMDKDRRTMARAFHTLLYAVDGCFEDIQFGKVLLRSDNPGELLEKEKIMVEMALRERAAGRKLLIYSIYTDHPDLLTRYNSILAEAGLSSRVMRSSVPTHKREEWLQKALEDNIDVMLCNQEIVKTGLDMYEFPTILYMQTGYSSNTILQSSKRSWRIGQVNPVRTYFASYADSPQMTVMKLVAKKLAVANQAKGNIAETSLTHLIDDDDGNSLMAMANEILDSLRERDHDPIVGSISSLSEDSLTGEYGATPMSAIARLLKLDMQEKHPQQAKKPAERKSVDPMDILSVVFATANQNSKKEHVEKPKKAANTTKRIGNSILVDDPFDLF